MISRDKVREIRADVLSLFSIVEKFLCEASSAFSMLYVDLNDIEKTMKFKIPLPKRLNYRNVRNYEEKFPTHLNRVLKNKGFCINLESEWNDSSLGLMLDANANRDEIKSTFNSVLEFINAKDESKIELYVYITIKDTNTKDCHNYSYCHMHDALEYGFNVHLISHKCLLIERGGVYVCLCYFPYENIYMSTMLGSSFSYISRALWNYRHQHSDRILTHKNDVLYLRYIQVAFDYVQSVIDLLEYPHISLVSIYSPPAEIDSMSHQDISKLDMETHYTRMQYHSMKLLAVLSSNLFKVFSDQPKEIDVNDISEKNLHNHLVSCLRQLCSTPQFYMHKQSSNNITKSKENDITSCLNALLNVNDNFTSHSEVAINNGRVDIKLTSAKGKTFLIECKILGENINRKGFFMKSDSDSLMKAILQIRQYLSNHNHWFGYIVIYAFDIISDDIVKCIQKALPKISSQLKYDNSLKLVLSSDDTLNVGIPCYLLGDGFFTVRLLICTLHTKTPTENFLSK